MFSGKKDHYKGKENNFAIKTTKSCLVWHWFQSKVGSVNLRSANEFIEFLFRCLIAHLSHNLVSLALCLLMTWTHLPACETMPDVTCELWLAPSEWWNMHRSSRAHRSWVRCGGSYPGWLWSQNTTTSAGTAGPPSSGTRASCLPPREHISMRKGGKGFGMVG